MYPDTFLKLNRGMKELDLFYKSKNEKNIPYVHWYYGKTGCGKSLNVRNEIKKLNLGEPAEISKNLEWFDGYREQDCVIFDEFRGNWCTIGYLLRVLDRYAMTVPIKGGFVNWNPKHIFITSCMAPEDVYKDCGENIQQLLRRIHDIKKFGKDKNGNMVFKKIKDEKPIENITIEAVEGEIFSDEEI